VVVPTFGQIPASMSGATSLNHAVSLAFLASPVGLAEDEVGDPIGLVELVHDVHEHVLQVPFDQELPRLLDRLADGVVVVQVLVLPR
jgi:hypothetical protein